jgi:hypothetical protein
MCFSQAVALRVPARVTVARASSRRRLMGVS